MSLAQVLLESNEYDQAFTLSSQARTAFQSSLGDDHWRTAAAGSIEGAALTGLERYQEAEALLLDSYAILSKDPAKQPAYLKDTLTWLVELYGKQEKPEEVAKYRALLAKSG